MYIKVKVKTESKKELVIAESKDHFSVSIRQKAERNMANNRILEIFRQYFKTKKVKIISGHHSQSKILSIE